MPDGASIPLSINQGLVAQNRASTVGGGRQQVSGADQRDQEESFTTEGGTSDAESATAALAQRARSGGGNGWGNPVGNGATLGPTSGPGNNMAEAAQAQMRQADTQGAISQYMSAEAMKTKAAAGMMQEMRSTITQAASSMGKATLKLVKDTFALADGILNIIDGQG